MDGVVVTDVVSWAERADARLELERSGATTVDERDDGLIATFADADTAFAAALELRSAGLLLTSRVAVAEGAIDSVDVGAPVDGPGVRRALALVRLGRAGVLLVPAVVADRAAELPGPSERWFLTLSELVGPEPVVALLPAEAPPAFTALDVPLPAPVRAAAALPFIGRAAALEALRERWREALGGERGTVALRASAGMGKTRLAAALAQEVHEGGGLVLASHFDASGAPHRPFADVLRFYADRRGAAELRTVLGATAAELARLVPDLESDLGVPRPVPGDADLERHRLYAAIDAWLASASLPSGLLLVLDDAHLAAPETVPLLVHLVRSKRPARLLVLLLCRDDETSAAWDELASLAGAEIDVVDLQPLAPDEIAAVAAAHRPAVEPVARRLAPQLAAVTAGNPLYVVQLAHHLDETGLGPARAAAGEDLIDAVGLPGTVRELLERRLELLGDVGLDVLSRAAIVGDPVDLDLLEAVADRDAASVAEVVEQGRRRGLLHDVEPGRVGFTHGLVRAAFAERIGATRRARLHARIADALLAGDERAVDERASDVARHLIAAGGDHPRLFEIARLAGAQAVSRVAYSEAATMFAAARDATPVDADAELRDQIALDLATAQHLAGRAAAVDAIVAVGQSAAARGDGPMLVRAALASGRGFFGRLAGEDVQRIGLLEAALDSHPARDSARAHLLARLATESNFGLRAANQESLVEEALSIARGLASPDVLVDVLIARQHALRDSDRVPERLATTAELMDVAERTGDPVQRTRALWFRADSFFEAGELGAAAAHMDECVALAEQIGQPLLLWASRIMHCGCVASTGDLAAAEAEAFAAYELGMRVGQPDAILFYGGQLYALRLEQARLRSIAHLFRPFADVEGAPQMILAMQALIDCVLGEHDDARRRLAAITAVGLDKIPEDDLRLSTLAHITEVARRLDDRDMAAELDALLEPDTGALIITVAGAVGLSGAVSHHRGVLRGVLGDGDGAIALLEDALARHEVVGAPVWLNRTRVELAKALGARDAARAEQLAARAADESGRIGLTAINDEATRFLAGNC